jgi:hypothetical protein
LNCVECLRYASEVFRAPSRVVPLTRSHQGPPGRFCCRPIRRSIALGPSRPNAGSLSADRSAPAVPGFRRSSTAARRSKASPAPQRCSTRHINMTSLAFLAPALVTAAVEGRFPRGIGVAALRDAPAEWSQQMRRLGLAPTGASANRVNPALSRPPILGTGNCASETAPQNLPKRVKETAPPQIKVSKARQERAFFVSL